MILQIGNNMINADMKSLKPLILIIYHGHSNRKCQCLIPKHRKQHIVKKIVIKAKSTVKQIVIKAKSIVKSIVKKIVINIKDVETEIVYSIIIFVIVKHQPHNDKSF